MEWVEDITGRDAQGMWSTLKGEEPKLLTEDLKHAIMRARFNPQRNYEIYTVTAVDGIKKTDIREMFKNSPQAAADTIRRLGNKIYSDRREMTKEVIT